MNAPVYFKRWAAEWEWVTRGLLLFLLLSGITQFTLFGLVSNYMLGFFAAQPEDVSFSTNITYAMLIASLPLQIRFLRYFELRSYLLTMILLGIGISILTYQVTNIYVFMLCRFLNGYTIAGTLLSSLLLILSRLKPQYAPVGFSVFYGAILGSGVSSGSLVYLVTDNLDWRDVYLFILLIQLISLVVVLVLVRSRSGMRPYPLYQLDSPSFILCLITYLAWVYTFIYGGKYYWLADGRIRASLTIGLCSLVVLIYRQTVVKRPYLHPHIFRSMNLVVGLLILAFYYGIKDSLNLIYQYATQVLHWDTEELILLALCNVAGLVTGMFLAAEMILSRKFTTTFFLIVGFSLLFSFNCWAYFIISTDLSFGDLAGPAMMQGLGSGLLFVPISLLIAGGLPAYTGFSGVTVAAVVRLVATCNSFAGLYALQLFYNQHFKEGFLRHTTLLDDAFSGRLERLTGNFVSAGYAAGPAGSLAARTVFGEVTAQSQLLTDMTIFRLFAFAILIMLLLVILVPPVYGFFTKRRKAYI